MAAVGADGRCQLTAVEALAEAAHLRTVEAEVMRHRTEAAVGDTLPAADSVVAVTSPVEEEVTPQHQAAADTTAVEAITVTKT